MRCLFAVFLFVSGQFQAPQGPRLEGVVNLNTATPEELRLLPGIGPSRIRNILAYRKAHPFRTVEELGRIKGIGRKSVRLLRMNLAVGGPTTIQKVLRPAAVETPPAAPPPPKPATPPPVAIRPRVVAQVRPGPPVKRRGDPQTNRDHRSIGNHCLPPP